LEFAKKRDCSHVFAFADQPNVAWHAGPSIFGQPTQLVESGRRAPSFCSSVLLLGSRALFYLAMAIPGCSVRRNEARPKANSCVLFDLGDYLEDKITPDHGLSLRGAILMVGKSMEHCRIAWCMGTDRANV
jgi:hypothetical protein